MKICLDAGHYGKYNQSPADKRYYESDMVWKLHLLQKKHLEAYGIKVITTRESQVNDRGLYDRGTAAKGCELFISDHSNAVADAINNKVDYPVSYCAINGSADGIGMALAQTIERIIGTKQSARIEHRRGQNGDYYGVLRGATDVGVPALILENSFHTNAAVTSWLLSDENLDKLAKAQADTIALYYGILEPEPVKKSGWHQEDGGWRFYLGDTGNYVVNDWYKDGKDWYWFDAAGMMVSNTWKTGEGGNWYYLTETGAMAREQWVIWKGELYRMSEDGSIVEGELCLTANARGAFKVASR